MALAVDILIVFAGFAYVIFKVCQRLTSDKALRESFCKFDKSLFYSFYLPMLVFSITEMVTSNTENDVVFWVAMIIESASLLWLVVVMIICFGSNIKN